jgi:hypothetical protein
VPDKNALLVWDCIVHVEACEAIAHFVPVPERDDLQIMALVAVLHLETECLQVILRVFDHRSDSAAVDLEELGNLFHVDLECLQK